jgi:di/tricarboxylate transporter
MMERGAKMTDCTKGFSELTPYETYRCFIEADTWKIIGRNAQRMWSDFTSTTNGEWAGIILGFAIFPALIASYILPFTFLGRLFRIAVLKERASTGERERKLRTGWGIYLGLSGLIMIGVDPHDRFMVIQGSWQIICGAAIFLLGPLWWADFSHNDQD